MGCNILNSTQVPNKKNSDGKTEKNLEDNKPIVKKIW